MQMIENLLLHGHVKRGCRFIGDKQVGAAGKTDGDQRTLAHATGEFVRELTCTGGGVRQSRFGQQTRDAIVHGGTNHILLGEIPRILGFHAGLDEIVGDTPAGFGTRHPLISEVRHGRIEILAGLADVD